jgi:peroxiredoxin
MYVEDGKINKIFEEPGKNNAGENGDPFEVSKAETMVKYLKGLNAG